MGRCLGLGRIRKRHVPHGQKSHRTVGVVDRHRPSFRTIIRLQKRPFRGRAILHFYPPCLQRLAKMEIPIP